MKGDRKQLEKRVGLAALPIVILLAGWAVFSQQQEDRARQAERQQKEEDSTAAMQDEVQWLQSHYAQFPVGGGWQLVQIEARPSQVLSTFEVPGSLEQGFRQRSEDQRYAITTLPCPNKNESVWQSIENGQIKIELRYQGSWLYSATCPKP